MTTTKRSLNAADAAEFLGISRFTLALWRRTDRGPVFLRHQGKLVRYRLVDLIKWETANLQTARSQQASTQGDRLI